MAIFPFLSHGSHNEWNDLAHFKASSLPPQIFSSHVWFIIPFHTLSVSCQRRALFWKVQEKDTDGKSVNFSSNINISQRYFICHLNKRVKPRISANTQFQPDNTSIFSPVITQLTATTWARTLWRDSCTYQTPTPGGFTGPGCCPATWSPRQTSKS